MSSIHKIPIKHVEQGMYISDTTPGLSDSGLNSRGLISRPETIKKLQAAGIAELYIDTSKGKASQFAYPVAPYGRDIAPKASLNEEGRRAQKVYKEARSLVGSLVQDVKMGNAIEVGPIEGLAEDISDSVLSNANALLCLSQIREKDQYLLEHSINVGVLMGVFTRYLGYAREEMHQLVTGALLHDIGKIRVPRQVLNKAGKLTDEEWLQMRSHVMYGEEVLLKSPGISNIAIAICAQHHEKLNGKGYPRGLRGDEITTYGRLASVVDIYDAITADRVYHKGQSPNETMRILADLGKTDLDKNLVYEFIRCMSVYPVGTLVELDSGKLGVVIQVHPKKANAPRIKLFYNYRRKCFESPKIVDLAGAHKDMKIVRAHDADALNIKVRDFIAID